ncbi:hypothetical protein ACFQJD_16320 [Haloplanus sp. GCM10025708]|uniref:hypothetical protein n=1 Tax=Haloferacaceae TaxID=1644056 RepID=UPI00361DEEA1
MAPSGLPTGTVSSDRERVETFPKDDASVDDLEHENAVLRAALEKERQERQELIDHYERLLEQERTGATESTPADERPDERADDAGLLSRLTDALGR